jgi:hypothetical protein
LLENLNVHVNRIDPKYDPMLHHIYELGNKVILRK